MKTLEQWGEEYDSASPKRRYELIMEILDTPMSTKLIEELDFGMYLSEIVDTLSSDNLFTEMQALIDKIQNKQPNIYKKEFQYFDHYMVDYYLFKNDREKVIEYSSRFANSPVQAIDLMMPMLDNIRLYGYIDVAVNICRKAYIPVKKSPDVIEDAAADLAIMIFNDMVEKVYQRIQNNESVDWDALAKDLKRFDLNNTPEFINEVKYLLTTELNGENLVSNFEFDNQTSMNVLLWSFMRYMLDQKKMSFVCSEFIFTSSLDFLEQRRPQNRRKLSSNEYFSFSKKDIDSYIADLIGGFLSTRQSEAFVILWGMDYLYDFLLSNNIITNSVYNKMLAVSGLLKKEFTNISPKKLWAYNFVHRWMPPDRVSIEDFTAESEIFSKTIEMQAPLSDEYISREQEMLEALASMGLPSDIKDSGIEGIKELLKHMGDFLGDGFDDDSDDDSDEDFGKLKPKGKSKKNKKKK